MSELVTLVLAAGQSRRMKSSQSKVLHPIAGRPLIYYPVAVAAALGATRVIVVTSPKDEAAIGSQLSGALPGLSIQTAVQAVAQGTGDAVRIGLERLQGTSTGNVLILYGDVPLITAPQIEALIRLPGPRTLNVATCQLSDPTGYGRIIRDAAGDAIAIREQRDLKSAAEHAVLEVNTGLYCAPLGELREALGTLTRDNAQGEYYLTDIVPFFAARGGVQTIDVGRDAVRGVNDRVQLWEAQELMNRRIVDAHRVNGVSIASGVYVDESVGLGNDSVIHAGCHLRGKTVVGASAVLDVGCVLTDARVEAGAYLAPYSVRAGGADAAD